MPHNIHVGGYFKAGEIVFHREGGKLRIIHADPRIYVTDELMHQWVIRPEYNDDPHFQIQWIKLENTAELLVPNIEKAIATFSDDFGAKYIYVIRDYLLPEMLWLLEWPD